MAKSRIRTKHEFFPTELGVIHVWAGGSIEYSGYVSVVKTHRKYRAISDIVGLRTYPYNPCGHFKAVFPKCKVDYLVSRPDPLGATRSYQLAGLTYLPRQDWPVFVDSAFSETMLERMSGYAPRANYHMVTAVRQEVDLPSFLIELFAPFKKLLAAAKTFWETFSSKCKELIGAYWAERRRHLARGINDIDSHWLAWNFAILPSLKDLRALIYSYSIVMKRLKHLRAINGKIVRVNYRERPIIDLEFTIPMMELVSEDPGAPKDLPFVFVFKGSCKLTMTSWAHAQFNIPLDLLNGVPGLSLAWAVYTGVLNPVGTAWEQTNFSWVLDWFRDTESKLEQKKVSLSPFPPAVISGQGSTLYREYLGTLEIVDINDDTNRYPVGAARFAIYDRREGDFAQFIEQPNLSDITLHQLSLIGAVATQRGKSRTKRPKWRRKRKPWVPRTAGQIGRLLPPSLKPKYRVPRGWRPRRR